MYVLYMKRKMVCNKCFVYFLPEPNSFIGRLYYLLARCGTSRVVGVFQGAGGSLNVVVLGR